MPAITNHCGFLDCACRYATVAKRVNVRKLKHDLWDRLDRSLPVASGENQPPVEQVAKGKRASFDKAPIEKSKTEQMSFQRLVAQMEHDNTDGQQKEASLSFYFICLLHLANEKVNEINLCHYSNCNPT